MMFRRHARCERREKHCHSERSEERGRVGGAMTFHVAPTRPGFTHAAIDTPLIRASRTFSPHAGRRATNQAPVYVAPPPARGERVAEGGGRGSRAITPPAS